MARHKRNHKPGLLDEFRAARDASTQSWMPPLGPEHGVTSNAGEPWVQQLGDDYDTHDEPSAVRRDALRVGVRSLAPAAPLGTLAWNAAVFGWCVLVMLIVGVSYPVLGHSWQWTEAGVGTAVIAVAGTWVWVQRPHLFTRSLLATTTAWLVVLALFLVGSVSSVVLRGRVYPVTSATARSYHLAHQYADDFSLLTGADKLLTYSIPDARGHYAEYQPAIDQLTALTTQLSNVTIGQLPDPSFIDVVNALKVAAYYTADGLTAKQQLLSVTDAALTAQVQSDRETLFSEAMTGWQALLSIAAKYHFSLQGSVHE
jgi:hypothetical protein